MPAAHRQGDICTGHGCFGPRPSAQGSPNVFINGKPSHRQGDAWHAHCCGPSCHGGQAAAGSPNVFVNGKPKCRIGDPVNCGSTMATGSPNVFVNS